MSSAFEVAYEEQPPPADVAAVRDGLAAFNEAIVGDLNYRPLACFVRDSRGEVVGGVVGGTYLGWLYVDTLWVRQDLRGHGYGSRLLAAAEDGAVRRGCRHAFLDTFSFRAPTFYQRHGYTVFGELPDFRPGHRRIYLTKRLQPAKEDTSQPAPTARRETSSLDAAADE